MGEVKRSVLPIAPFIEKLRRSNRKTL